jgi:hypothetical protein
MVEIHQHKLRSTTTSTCAGCLPSCNIGHQSLVIIQNVATPINPISMAAIGNVKVMSIIVVSFPMQFQLDMLVPQASYQSRVREEGIRS